MTREALPIRSGPRGLRWLLAASIALNIALALALLLPLLGAHAWLGRHPHHLPPLPSPRELGEALPAPRQALLREVTGRHRQSIREAVGQSRRSRRGLDQLLRQERVDPVQLQQAFRDVRASETAAAAAVHAMLAELMVELSKEERQAVLERFERRHSRPRGAVEPPLHHAPPEPPAPH